MWRGNFGSNIPPPPLTWYLGKWVSIVLTSELRFEGMVENIFNIEECPTLQLFNVRSLGTEGRRLRLEYWDAPYIPATNSVFPSMLFQAIDIRSIDVIHFHHPPPPPGSPLHHYHQRPAPYPINIDLTNMQQLEHYTTPITTPIRLPADATSASTSHDHQLPQYPNNNIFNQPQPQPSITTPIRLPADEDELIAYATSANSTSHDHHLQQPNNNIFNQPQPHEPQPHEPQPQPPPPPPPVPVPVPVPVPAAPVPNVQLEPSQPSYLAALTGSSNNPSPQGRPPSRGRDQYRGWGRGSWVRGRELDRGPGPDGGRDQGQGQGRQ